MAVDARQALQEKWARAPAGSRVGWLRGLVGERLTTFGLRLLGRAGAAHHAERILGGLPDDRVASLLREALGRLSDEHLALLLEGVPVERRLQYDRHEILLGVSSKTELMRLRGAVKEPWTVRWIEACVKPENVFYDIGANVGAYSLLAARIAGVRARVVAFEPAYATFASLCGNIIRNGLEESITPLCIPLAATTAPVSFRYRDLRPGVGLHEMASGAHEPLVSGRACFEQLMLGMSLDEVVSRLALPPPTHMKLDVDGPELEVLEGAAGVLEGPSLRTLLIEVTDARRDAGRVRGLLEARGLELAGRFRRVDAAGLESAYSYDLFARDPGELRMLLKDSALAGAMENAARE